MFVLRLWLILKFDVQRVGGLPCRNDLRPGFCQRVQTSYNRMMNWNVYIEYRVQCTANPVDILFLLVGTDEKNQTQSNEKLYIFTAK